MDLSIFTQCYEKDYINVLSEPRLKQMLELLKQPTHIVINSPDTNPEPIISLCKERQSQGLISKFYKTGNAAKIKEVFALREKDFSCNLHYRICVYNMAAIYFCPTKYLCFFTGDSIPVVVNDFLEKSLEQDQTSKELYTYSLCWQEPINVSTTCAFEEDDNFFYNKTGFSDQHYLMNISKFNLPELLQHASSEGYPHHDAFESRMWQYMVKNMVSRAIFKRGSYHHQNYR